MLNIRTVIRAAEVARKHCKNWLGLLVKAALRRKGIFKARDGTSTGLVDARSLLRSLVRVESGWDYNREGLRISFQENFLSYPFLNGKFGIKVPISLQGYGIITHRYFDFLDKEHGYGMIDYAGKTVLDIGAYVGDTAILFLSRGARSVIAVEPNPRHYEILCMNTENLPVVPIKASVGSKVPISPSFEVDETCGWVRLSTLGLEASRYVDVPLYSLSELIEKYNPDIVKIDCEGCEHFMLDEIARYAGKVTFVVEFHDIQNKRKEGAIAYLEERIGKGKVLSAGKDTCVILWEATHAK